MYGTVDDILKFTGVTPEDLGLSEEADPNVALSALITTWLERITVAMNIRLGESAEIRSSDSRYKGLIDIAVRTTAKMVAVAQQQRTSPIVQINDFSVGVLDTSAVMNSLDKELLPYIRKSSRRAKISVFSSIVEDDE